MNAAWVNRAPWILLVGSAIILGILSCGCANQLQGAQVFKTQASKGFSEFVDRFDAWDKAEQEKILVEAPAGQKEAKLREYLANVQAPIRTSITAFSGVMAAYSNALKMAELGMKADWLGLGLKLVQTGAELIDTLKRLKVNVPFQMPSFLVPAPPSSPPVSVAPSPSLEGGV